MQHTVYFLIEPNDRAKHEFPVRAETSIADILLGSILTSRNCADHSGWRVTDSQLAVKLLYLARLREYVPLVEDECALKILGSASIAENVFDRWWSIRLFGMEEGPSEQMHGYLAACVDKAEPTGSQLLNEWIASLKSQ